MPTWKELCTTQSIPNTPKSKKPTVGSSGIGAGPSSVHKSKPGPKKKPRLAENFSTSSLGSPSKFTVQSNNIRFQFFIADESLGAISKSPEECSSSNAFFDEALAAFTIINTTAYCQFAGVRVTIESPPSRPIFVPWRDTKSYDEMMKVVAEKAAATKERFDVEVTCIQKGR